MIELRDDPAWGVHAIATFGPELPAPGSPEDQRLTTRPGEVVLVLRASSGSVWLQTKEFYPDGIFRVPTGSLKQGEAPDEGYRRELAEETGVSPLPAAERLARISYRRNRSLLPFESYLYLVRGIDVQPSPSDPGERISGWRLTPAADLAAVARELRGLGAQWGSWGVFRAVGHEVLLGVLPKAGR